MREHVTAVAALKGIPRYRLHCTGVVVGIATQDVICRLSAGPFGGRCGEMFTDLSHVANLVYGLHIARCLTVRIWRGGWLVYDAMRWSRGDQQDFEGVSHPLFLIPWCFRFARSSKKCRAG